MNLEECIGVQTMLTGNASSNPTQDLTSIAKQALEKGFKAIEVVPAQFQTVAGRQATSFLQKTYGEKERQEIRDALQPFKLITVHGSNIFIEITSGKIDKALWNPNTELIQFAHDIGAHLVTFHDLRRGPDWQTITDQEMAEYHIQWGKKAAEHAEEWDLTTGYEMTEKNVTFLDQYKILEKKGRER